METYHAFIYIDIRDEFRQTRVVDRSSINLIRLWLVSLQLKRFPESDVRS